MRPQQLLVICRDGTSTVGLLILLVGQYYIETAPVTFTIDQLNGTFAVISSVRENYRADHHLGENSIESALPPKMAKLGWIGIGNMGKAMSRNLAMKGNLVNPLLLWNRSLENAENHSKAVPNTAVASSLEDLIEQADMIWLCLSNSEAVSETFGKILSRNVHGKLFVECSTVAPEDSDALASRIIGAGAEMVSMPVFGEPSMATAGNLTCVVAGTSQSVGKVLPYLVGIIGRSVIDFSGENCGKASLLKIVGNTFIISMIEALAEGHVLAENSGLGSANLEKFLAAVFPGAYMVHSKRMSTGAYHTTPPIVSIPMAKTVASHVLELAERTGTKLPAYKLAQSLFDVIDEQTGGKGDLDGMVGAIRVLSGGNYELAQV